MEHRRGARVGRPSASWPKSNRTLGLFRPIPSPDPPCKVIQVRMPHGTHMRIPPTQPLPDRPVAPVSCSVEDAALTLGTCAAAHAKGVGIPTGGGPHETIPEGCVRWRPHHLGHRSDYSYAPLITAVTTLFSIGG